MDLTQDNLMCANKGSNFFLIMFLLEIFCIWLVCWQEGVSMCDLPLPPETKPFFGAGHGGRAEWVLCVLLCSPSSPHPPHLLLLSQHRWWRSAGSFATWDFCALLERGISSNRKLISAYYIDYHSRIKLILWGINSILLTSQFWTNWQCLSQVKW